MKGLYPSVGDVHKSERLTKVAESMLPYRLVKRAVECWVRRYVPCGILPMSPVLDGVYVEFRVHHNQQHPNWSWCARKLVGHETAPEQDAETVRLLVHKYVQYQQPWNRLLRWIRAVLPEIAEGG